MYRILRDNKEHGPLSLEDLLALQLKPLDLIWIEGKSAGWRYPSEIDALKPYLDPQSTKPDVLSTPTTVSTHPASTNTRSIPAMTAVPQHFSDTEDNKEEELTNEKLEKKAAELYQRVQAFAQQQEQKAQGTQTKYARSLDELKQDYADWLHRKKQKKNFKLVSLGKSWKLVAGAACIILVAGALVWMKDNQKTPQNGLKPGEQYISDKSFVSHETPVKKNISVPPVIPTDPAGSINAHPEEKAVLPRELSVDEFIDSVRRALARGSHKKSNRLVTRNDEETQPAGITTDADRPDPEPAPVKKELPSAPRVNMNASYQQDAHKKTISSVEVTIQNNSSDLLNTVSVDIFYYKKGNKLFDKETLYFNNIQPGSSMTLSRPGNKRAMTAHFQLGQINLQN